MAQVTVGIRELKARLASYVRQVKAGNTLIITERGKPIGRIIPVKPSSVQARTNELVAAGLAAWSGHPLARGTPRAQTRGKRTVAELLLENRE